MALCIVTCFLLLASGVVSEAFLYCLNRTAVTGSTCMVMYLLGQTCSACVYVECMYVCMHVV